MNHNLYTLFQSHFPAELSKTFLETEEGACYSFNDLERETARYAALLRSMGVSKGDRLISQIEKSPQGLFLYLACVRAGVIYLPLNPAYRTSEMEYIFLDGEPKGI